MSLADYIISFEKLNDIFTESENNSFILRPDFGIGSLTLFNLESGLKARFWDCVFYRTLQIHNDASGGRPYFNLAFFSKCDGVHLGCKSFDGMPVWDTVFFSSSTIFNIYVKSPARAQCLSISFSPEWVSENFLDCSQSFLYFEKQLAAFNVDSLLGSMTVEDKRNIAYLVRAASRKKSELFYIKSAVLKRISDFFKKLESKELLFLK